MDTAFLQRYDIQNVGDGSHNELWVPAEELEMFNRHIEGKIEVVKTFLGEKYTAPEDVQLAELISSLSK
ncbi:hypothetical protein [Chitinophaga pinensis]|uniref:hypothetical protein n=1 Tax=Chitinophaga pinensis TaxID=79329 RepID=UPI001C9957EE|nr:hypothetical protein [Chitinophaga pinensis]